MPRGRLPTAMRATTLPAAGSTITTLPPRSSETYSRSGAGSAARAAVASSTSATTAPAAADRNFMDDSCCTTLHTKVARLRRRARRATAAVRARGRENNGPRAGGAGPVTGGVLGQYALRLGGVRGDQIHERRRQA